MTHELPKIPESYVVIWAVFALALLLAFITTEVKDCNIRGGETNRREIRECRDDLRQWTRPPATEGSRDEP